MNQPLVLVVDREALRRERLRAALTQHELARVAGLDRSTIARLEAGSPASPRSVRSIALALGIDAGLIAKVVAAS